MSEPLIETGPEGWRITLADEGIVVRGVTLEECVEELVGEVRFLDVDFHDSEGVDIDDEGDVDEDEGLSLANILTSLPDLWDMATLVERREFIEGLSHRLPGASVTRTKDRSYKVIIRLGAEHRWEN